MNPVEIQHVVGQAIRDWHNFPWLPWAVTIVLCMVSLCVTVYFAERLRNKAAMQLLEKMTDIAEGVKASHELRNQLRVAALETRLHKHQEAHTLWRELVNTAHDPQEASKKAMECQDWLCKNSLYLSEEARVAFYRSYSGVFLHNSYMRAERTPENIAKTEELLSVIVHAGDAIEKAVALPPLHIEPLQKG